MNAFGVYPVEPRFFIDRRLEQDIQRLRVVVIDAVSSEVEPEFADVGAQIVPIVFFQRAVILFHPLADGYCVGKKLHNKTGGEGSEGGGVFDVTERLRHRKAEVTHCFRCGEGASRAAAAESGAESAVDVELEEEVCIFSRSLQDALFFCAFQRPAGLGKGLNRALAEVRPDALRPQMGEIGLTGFSKNH